MKFPIEHKDFRYNLTSEYKKLKTSFATSTFDLTDLKLVIELEEFLDYKLL